VQRCTSIIPEESIVSSDSALREYGLETGVSQGNVLEERNLKVFAYGVSEKQQLCFSLSHTFESGAPYQECMGYLLLEISTMPASPVSLPKNENYEKSANIAFGREFVE
jgi:hypothetical protein